MTDPSRRNLWQVLRGQGTPSLRGLLTRAVVGVGLVLGVLTALAVLGVFAATTSYRDDQQVAVQRQRVPPHPLLQDRTLHITSSSNSGSSRSSSSSRVG